MLVLGRKDNESILIGDNIRITIVGRSGSTVRLGVEAPHDVRIMRAELAAAIAAETDLRTVACQPIPIAAPPSCESPSCLPN